MSKKLAAKASLIQLPPVLTPAQAAAAVTGDAGQPSPAPAGPVLPPAADPGAAQGGVAGRAADVAGAAAPVAGVAAGAQAGPAQAGAEEFARAPVSPAAAPASPTAPPRAKTAPGSMAIFMASQSAAVQEAEELRARLRAFDGALPVRRLDPRSVRASRWANRHDDAFHDKAFEQLKQDIAAAGTNVQAVAVRPVAPAAPAGGAAARAGLLGRGRGGVTASAPGLQGKGWAGGAQAAAAGGPVGAVEGAEALDGTQFSYEIVFGHRRHRACLELGLPLQAVVTELDDRALFEAMDRENRARKNLSAWEQGTMYRRALDGGLYASQRKLAEAVGVDLSLVSKSVALARLPDAVIAAFPSPLDIQFRWAQPLGEALQRDPDGLVARARAVAARKAGLTARQVLEALLKPVGPVLNRSTPEQAGADAAAAESSATAAVQFQRESDGHAVLRFEPGVLTPEREQALRLWMQTAWGVRLD